MIRHAKVSEITDILQITKACAQHMIKNDIFQWNEHYPSKQAFVNDIAKNQLYVLEFKSKLIGTIVLSTIMDPEYVPIQWLTPNTNNLYIHRLAVLPTEQGQGYAQQLMEYGENYAIKNGFTSVRLDTFSQNKRNIKFYKKRGYQQLADIYFPKQSKYPFHCFELTL